MLQLMGAQSLGGPIRLVILFSPTPVQVEVIDSPNQVIVEDASCSPPFELRRSLAEDRDSSREKFSRPHA